jgi:hypothetical protein
MSADGSIGDLKRHLSNKCGLSISKVDFNYFSFSYFYNRIIYSDVSI